MFRQGSQKGIHMSRSALAVVLLVMSAACSSPAITSPSPPSTATVPIVWPAPSGPSRTFNFAAEVSYPVSDYTKRSSFVLYDNGAFVLNYPSGSYRGSHTVSDGAITFQWEGWSTAGSWAATGVLKGDLLTVQYNVIMSLTDFEDAIYALVR